MRAKYPQAINHCYKHSTYSLLTVVHMAMIPCTHVSRNCNCHGNLTSLRKWDKQMCAKNEHNRDGVKREETSQGWDHELANCETKLPLHTDDVIPILLPWWVDTCIYWKHTIIHTCQATIHHQCEREFRRVSQSANSWGVVLISSLAYLFSFYTIPVLSPSWNSLYFSYACKVNFHIISMLMANVTVVVLCVCVVCLSVTI